MAGREVACGLLLPVWWGGITSRVYMNGFEADTLMSALSLPFALSRPLRRYSDRRAAPR